MNNTLFKPSELKTLKFKFEIEIKTLNKSFELDEGWNFYWIESSTFKNKKTQFWKNIKENKSKQYGVYILFNLNENEVKPIYVGETNNFTKRSKLKGSNNKCQYILLINWEEYRIDNNRRVHENWFIKQFKIQELENVQRKNNNVLKEWEIKELKNKFENLKILLDYFIKTNLFIQTNSFTEKNKEKIQRKLTKNTQKNEISNQLYPQNFWKETFYIKNRNQSFFAKALITKDLKIEILKDSWFKKNEQSESDSSWKKKTFKKNLQIIKSLQQQEIIYLDGNKYIFKKNYSGFNSLSASSRFFVNNYSSGRTSWKTQDNKSLNDFLEPKNSFLKENNEKLNLKDNQQKQENKNKLSKILYNQKIRNKTFYLKSRDQLFYAKGLVTKDLKITILPKSWFKKNEQNESDSSWKKKAFKKNLQIIESLQQQEIIYLNDNKYIFKKNYQFNSLSNASSFFFNRSSNGRSAWKTKENKTINDFLKLKFNQS